MKTYKHKLYKINTNKGVIGLIPSLNKYFIFENGLKLPNQISSIKSNITKNNSQNSIQLVLILTNNCNLACKYCYEIGEHKRNTDTMTDLMIDNIFRYIHLHALKTKCKNVRITFFGGEPTLASKQLSYSLDKITELRKVAPYNIKSSIVTNGFVKKDLLGLLDNFDHITVSIDGYEHIQDFNRPTLNGKSSSSVVLKTIDYLYSTSQNKLGLRTTITKSTLELMGEIANYFYNKFPDIPQCYEPLMLNDQGDEYNFSKFLNNYFSLIKTYEPLKQKIRTSIFSLIPKPSFCGLKNRFVVFPNATITSCHRVDVANPKDKILKSFRIGSLRDGSFIFHNPKMLNYLNGKTECNDCFLSYFCNGGCPAYKVNLGIKTTAKHPYCEEIKKFYINYFIYKLNLN